MDLTFQEIYNFFNLHYCDYKKEFTDLSFDNVHNHYLVNDTHTAFDFDSLKLHCYMDDFKSADALYFGVNNKNCLYFIEFKNGNKIKNFRNDCKIKGIHSKIILRFILSYLNLGVNLSNLKIHYIIVINSTSAGTPSFSLGVALASRCQNPNSQMLINYLKPKLTNCKIMDTPEFYDNIEVWLDTQFTEKISKI